MGALAAALAPELLHTALRGTVRLSGARLDLRRALPERRGRGAAAVKQAAMTWIWWTSRGPHHAIPTFLVFPRCAW